HQTAKARSLPRGATLGRQRLPCAGWLGTKRMTRKRGAFHQEANMKKWQCVVCGLIYDEALGWPDDGIAPGTRWEDVPEDWLCPDCGVGKSEFEMIEIA